MLREPAAGGWVAERRTRDADADRQAGVVPGGAVARRRRGSPARAERAQYGIVRQQGNHPEVLRRRMRRDARPQPKPARGSWRALQVPFADRAHRGNHRRAGDARRLEHDLRGDARMSAFANMALGSVTTRVLHLCHIPVVVIH